MNIISAFFNKKWMRLIMLKSSFVFKLKKKVYLYKSIKNIKNAQKMHVKT